MEKSKLLCSGMASLWGIITPNVRKVSVDLEKNVISIHFYYNDTPTEMEVELSEEAATELIAHFPEPFLLDCERYVIPSPEKIMFKGMLIYSRYE